MYRACGLARSIWKRLWTASRRCSLSTVRNTHKKQSEKPMTLAETLLQKLSDWRPAEEGRPSGSFALSEHGWTVNVSADRVDTLSAAITEVEAVRHASLKADIVSLEAHARKA